MPLQIILLLLALTLISFGATFLIKKFAHRYKIVDIPNQRSSHEVPTPRGGGLAIVVTWFLGLIILFFLGKIHNNLFYALLSGTLLAIISLIDDVVDLKPVVRLTAQIITAALGFYFINGLQSFLLLGWNIPIVIAFPIIVLGIVWFINLYNFLDGIDGYASIEAVMVLAALFLFTRDNINLLLTASVIGFLIWNWPKAKIFMGDVGSTQLGFVIAILGLYYHNQGQFSILLWVILTSPFWFDATLTLFRRWRNHEKLSQAHKKHAYQRITQAGFSHLKTDLCLIGINLFIIFCLYLVICFKVPGIPVLVAVILLLYFIVKRIDRKKPFKN